MLKSGSLVASQSPTGFPLYLMLFHHFLAACMPETFSNSGGLSHLDSNQMHFPTDFPVVFIFGHIQLCFVVVAGDQYYLGGSLIHFISLRH